MTEILELPLEIREVPAPAAYRPEDPAGGDAPADREMHASVRPSDVYVLFTSLDGTLAALRVARDLAASLSTSTVRLVDFRVIQIGAPVEAPTGRSPIEADGFLDRVRAEGIDVRVNVYVCRNASCAIPHVFTDHSLIVIGGRHRWWPTRATRLRRMLEDHGHLVVFVEERGRRAQGRQAVTSRRDPVVQ